MPKRNKIPSTSSSSNCDAENTTGNFSPNLTNGHGSQVEHTNGNRGSKKSRNSSVEPREISSMISYEIILKDEIPESEEEAEPAEVADSPQQTTKHGCASRSAAHESQHELRRSTRRQIFPKEWKAQWTSKVPTSKVPEPLDTYFEGCLVMAPLYLPGYPLWPAMIRKPCAKDVRHPNYIWEMGGVTYLFVQFFTEQTAVRWRAVGELKVFRPAESYTCDNNGMDSSEIEEFEKAIRIAKAAVNYSVEARLAKFTFPDAWPKLNKLGIDDLLAEVENVNTDHTTNAAAPQPPQNYAVSLVGDEDAALTRGKNRVLDTRRKLREAEETNRSLTTENSRLGEKLITLEETLKLKDIAMKVQENGILKLQAEVLVLQENLEKERVEKRECQKMLEEMRSEFRKLAELFDNEMMETDS